MNIELIDLTQTVLIVPYKTGISYTNQVGGTACQQMELEGFIVPIEYDTPIESPDESLTRELCLMFPEGNPGLVERQEALGIQQLLFASVFTKDIEINWNRLQSSMESWVHVLVAGPLGECIAESGCCEAILTWPNSD